MQRISRLNFFTRREMAELPKHLTANEQVIAVLSGFYTSGTAILCVTNKRLIILDKKWVRLSYEDIRFEAISEVHFSQQAFLASARFYIAGRNVAFKSWYRGELRTLVQFVQDKMFESRHGGGATADYNHHIMKNITKGAPALGAQVIAEMPEADVVDARPVQSLYSTVTMPKHVIERVQRYQRAARFVGDLSQN